MDDNQSNQLKTIIFNINNYKALGKDKYIEYYKLMCPKAREIHLNKYKLIGYDIPEYLKNETIEHFTSGTNNNIYIILLIILIIIILIIIKIIICDK
jgi:hypothetical protein